MDIQEIRDNIKKTDDKIFDLFITRFELVAKIRSLKKARGLKVKDKTREKELIEKQISRAGLPEKFIKKIYKTVFKQAYRILK